MPVPSRCKASTAMKIAMAANCASSRAVGKALAIYWSKKDSPDIIKAAGAAGADKRLSPPEPRNNRYKKGGRPAKQQQAINPLNRRDKAPFGRDVAVVKANTGIAYR